MDYDKYLKYIGIKCEFKACREVQNTIWTDVNWWVPSVLITVTLFWLINFPSINWDVCFICDI